mgnify:FL=1
MKEQGITRAIIRISPEAYSGTQAQIYALHESGLEMEGYIYLPLDKPLSNFRSYLDTALFLCLDMVDRVWLDCEEDGLDVIARIHEAVERFREFKVGIYTRRNWWETYIDDPENFSYLPLWDADYDDVPDLEDFTPYGGWTKRFGKQYAGNQPFCGTTVDFNVFAA